MIEPIRIEVSLDVMFPSVNCYLIPGKQLTLIDCGLDTPQNWEKLQKVFHEHGYQVSDLEQIIITHEHRDHIGLLPKLLEETNATIRAPKMIEAWFSKPDEMKKQYKQFLKVLIESLGFPDDKLKDLETFLSMLRKFPTIKKMERFEFFEEGDFLAFGNTEWETLNTLGHCPTQHIFLQKEERRIFSSDMILAIAPMPIVVEDPKQTGHAIPALLQLLDSFERLRKFEIEKIYPGHGPMFTNANQTFDKQIARIEMRKGECLAAVQSGLQTPYQINRKMYPYHNIPPNFSGMHMVLGYLDLLMKEELVTKSTNKKGHLCFTPC